MAAISLANRKTSSTCVLVDFVRGADDKQNVPPNGALCFSAMGGVIDGVLLAPDGASVVLPRSGVFNVQFETKPNSENLAMLFNVFLDDTPLIPGVGSRQWFKGVIQSNAGQRVSVCNTDANEFVVSGRPGVVYLDIMMRT